MTCNHCEWQLGLMPTLAAMLTHKLFTICAFVYQQNSERMELQDKLRTDLLQDTELSEEEVVRY